MTVRHYEWSRRSVGAHITAQQENQNILIITELLTFTSKFDLQIADICVTAGKNEHYKKEKIRHCKVL